MRSLLSGFVKNQSGALSLEDGLTVLTLTIGFAALLALMNSTIVELYAAILSVFPGTH